MHENPIEAEVYATIPAVTKALDALRAMEERQRSLGYVPTADEAREAIFSEALSTVQEGKPFPADVGKRAAAAWTKGLEAEYDARCTHLAVSRLRYVVDGLKADHAEDALAALAVVFDGFMTELRAAVADLDGARSAEAAIARGGKAPGAWRTMTELVGRLTAIRLAQRNIIKRDEPDDTAIRRLRLKGFFEVRTVDLDDVPRDIRQMLQFGGYNVDYLLWLATQDGAYVPRSFEDMESNDVADTGIPDGPVADYNPIVTPHREPRPALIPPHARAPHIDHSQPTPDKPTSNGSVPDPVHVRPSY